MGLNSPFFLTFKLALLSTTLLLIICTPLAYWCARKKTWLKAFVEMLAMLPIVLPPTVLGFYLLMIFSPQSPLGSAWRRLTGGQLVFSFEGLVVASMIYSLPFVLLPIKIAFENINEGMIEKAKVLGAKPLDRFFHVSLPLAKNGLLAAAIFGFAHTLGEFGVVLMIGGNIPQETQVLSIALYDEVEQLNYQLAYQHSGILLFISALCLLCLYRFNYGKLGKKP